MGVVISFQADLILDEAQEAKLAQITQRYEQTPSFQYQLNELDGESLSYYLDDKFTGDIKYPYSDDPLDWSDFEGTVLAWLTEIRNTFGGQLWQVFHNDIEPVTWLGDKRAYYHEPL